ncbi:glycosyltransferase [Allorhodopirellula solitaria]|uniref:glycosyltransferase n=1 Tax=Allorhodopirellula solitaria TaxID=2527987 RepID=UPI001C958920|nr:glycosyltransferase [Allorhodopirellula solitaria]
MSAATSAFGSENRATMTSREERRPFILYIGGSIPRKRFDWALQVWQPFADRVELLTLGVDPTRVQRQMEAIEPCNRARVKFLDFIPDEDLPDLLASAKCVLYPTLYEGFGLPVVEANAVGTRIVQSPCGSLAELIGPLSVSLPTDDDEAWSRAIGLSLETPPSERNRNDAQAWARQFDWDATADAYQCVFQSIAAR